MNVLSGCHNTRNMIHIKEIECPRCGSEIELFIKDTFTVTDSKCDECGYTITDGTKTDYVFD